MSTRFTRHRDTGDSGSVAVRDEVPPATRATRERHMREGAEERHGAAPTLRDIRRRERDEFGGVAWGSTLLGWLAAAGIVAILAGILGATGAALALNEAGDDITGAEAETIGWVGGVGLLVVLAIGYFFGGYAAGRMARFDGARQGAVVWMWGLAASIVVALLALIGGSEYNVLDQLNLPRVPVDEGTLTTGGIIALLGGLAVSFVAAVLGGALGERFHRKVDRHGYAEVEGVR